MKEYLTVKEFAAAAHVSQQTIYKQMNGRLAPYVKTVKGQKRIMAAALKDFYDDAAENSESTDIQPESTEKQLETTENQSETTDIQPESTAEEQPRTTENNSATSRDQQIEALNRLIAIVQKELEEKDKQLAIKDKQIQDLSDRLAEAMQLTRGQQYIAAADKTTGLLEAEARRGQQEETQEEAGSEVTAYDQQMTARQEETEKQQRGLKGFLRRLFG